VNKEAQADGSAAVRATRLSRPGRTTAGCATSIATGGRFSTTANIRRAVRLRAASGPLGASPSAASGPAEREEWCLVDAGAHQPKSLDIHGKLPGTLHLAALRAPRDPKLDHDCLTPILEEALPGGNGLIDALRIIFGCKAALKQWNVWTRWKVSLPSGLLAKGSWSTDRPVRRPSLSPWRPS
jgi:hypothetical protein